jgi:predicted 3-demethylubiquinone-9 3-methyltransferase (glyoxalase superfamily)
MTVEFQLAGQHFMALNGGPTYRLTEAFSLMVNVDTQQEVDTLWSKLTANGGEESRCGWLKDAYGLSWQIIPTQFAEIMRSGNAEGTQRAFKAMMTMRKLVIADLLKAYEGR